MLDQTIPINGFKPLYLDCGHQRLLATDNKFCKLECFGCFHQRKNKGIIILNIAVNHTFEISVFGMLLVYIHCIIVIPTLCGMSVQSKSTELT